MRVLLTKGRIDQEAEATFARELTHLRRKPPYYFFSWIMRELEPACRAQGWNVDVLSIGKPVPQRLPRPDVLVNLISEPLVCRRSLERLDVVVREGELKVINSVDATLRSARTALSGVFAASGVANARAPLTTRFTGALDGLPEHIEASGHRWPVLVRPSGTHGSKGLKKIDDPEALPVSDTAKCDLLVSEFVDFRSGDGLYRKYRMIWADGTIFRRHVITATNWNITGPARVDMVDRPETITAEKEFLASSGDALDERIADLFRIVGLDFGVIDFAVLDSGEIIVFELNGTFQISRSIRPEVQERWGYLEANNEAIVNAIVASIARRGM